MDQDSVNIEAALGNADNGVLRLGVLGTGLELVDGHYEYVFQISHPWGCSWRVQHRFRHLLSLHGELVTQLTSVPSFPPKHSVSQRLFTSEKDIATKRIVELQRYLQLMVANTETGQNAAVQKALGATQPQAPGIVRVTNWEHNRASSCASMELEFDLDEDAVQAPSCSAPIESVEVQVHVMPKLGPLGGGSEASEKTHIRSFREPVRIADLPIGREIEFKVRLCNIVGGSPPLAMRIMVPGPDDAPDSPIMTISSLRPDTGPAPPLPSEQIGEGCRVSALWAGNGYYYDAIVRRGPSNGKVTVDWLRPAPMSGEELHCVLDDGGDDTAHRHVPVHQLRPRQAGPSVRSKSVESPEPPVQPLRTQQPTPEAPSVPRFEASRERKQKAGTNFSELFDAEDAAEPLEAQPRQPGSSKLADLFDREDEEMPAETTSPFAKPRAFFASTANNVNRSNLAEKLRPPPASTSSNLDKRSLAELFDADNDELPPRNPKPSSKISPRASGLFLESEDTDDTAFAPRPKQPQKAESRASAMFADEEDEDAVFDAKAKKTAPAKRASVFSNDDDDDHDDGAPFNPAPRPSKTAQGAKASMFEEENDDPFDPSKTASKTVSGPKASIFEEEEAEEDDEGGSNGLSPVQSTLPASKVSISEEGDTGKANQLPSARPVDVDEMIAAQDEAASSPSRVDEEVASNSQAAAASSAELPEDLVSSGDSAGVDISSSGLQEECSAGAHVSDVSGQVPDASAEAAAVSEEAAATAELLVDAASAVCIPADLPAPSEATMEVSDAAIAAIVVSSGLPTETEDAAASDSAADGAAASGRMHDAAVVDVPLELPAADEEATAASVEVPVGILTTVDVSEDQEETLAHQHSQHSIETVECEPSHKLSTASAEAAAAVAASVMDECAAAIKEAADDTAEQDIGSLAEMG